MTEVRRPVQVSSRFDVSHMLMALCASDVHAHEIERCRFDITLAGMAFQVRCLFLEILEQSLILRGLVHNVP